MGVGRKDGFPGADGSTITQVDGDNASTIPIYGENGNTLTEGGAGVNLLNITTEGVMAEHNAQTFAIKNPLTFIYSADEPKDWYTNEQVYQNNILWRDDKKSAYDPCPPKWKVPGGMTWKDFSNTTAPYYIQGVQTNIGLYYATNGRAYAQLSWYPTSAFRRTDMGVHAYVGRNCSLWSSTITQQDAIGLNFNMNGINNTTTNYRATGFPVRCIQE